LEWRTIPRIPKNLPMSVPITHHWNLKFFKGLKPRKTRSLGYGPERCPS